MPVRLVLLLGSLIWKGKMGVLFGSDRDSEIRYRYLDLKSYGFVQYLDIER